MDFAFDNGSDALALTDHGNMNGLAYQVLHAKKMRAEGRNFKPIYGIEAYFVKSLSEWRKTYESLQEVKKKKRAAQSAATVEDEGETKSGEKDFIKRRSHLILLAKNPAGLSNLFQIVSKSYKSENFYRYPRIDFEMLREHSEGVIVSSACMGGVLSQDYWMSRDFGDEAIQMAMQETVEQFQSIFGEDFFGELQWSKTPEQHEINKNIIAVSKKTGLKLISTADSHYPNPDAFKDRELYRQLGWLGRAKPGYADQTLPSSREQLAYELYPKNGDEMWEAYKRYSSVVGVEYDDELIRESITTTHKIAHELIEDFYPETAVRLPDFVVPDGDNETSALTKLCLTGLKSRQLDGKPQYASRLKEELDVISERGFSKYFLTMKAIADKATEVQLTGAGRGSAAGSLVSYVLGITQVDPIRYGLLFSRFLRRDAKDYPDIDYDVSDPMALKELLIEEWGEDTVVPITNWNTLQLRSLVKDISKFYGIPFTEVNQVTGKMLKEATPKAKKKHGITAGVYSPTFEELMEHSESLQKFLRKYPQVKTHVNALYGQVRSASRHAGGVVIADDLHKHMPLINSGGVRQTPWSEGQNVRHLEPLGFIKFDILGLASLRMVEGCIKQILQRHHGIQEPTFEEIKKYYEEKLHPDTIDFDDQDVYENVFHRGRWAGIFQFTEKGAQGFCKRAKPTSIIDLAAVTSIYRPGPLSAKVHDMYVDAKEDPVNIEYVHPVVEEVTNETFGFLIFQEQIALLAHKLGKDLSLDEGNKLRKLLTKKGTGKGHEEKTVIYDKFIAGCLEKNMTRHQADGLWRTFEYFSGYGFNKSHAVSYSILSYQCAWLFNYYPSEWMAAFLDKEPESRKEKAIGIAKNMGFDVRGVDINLSSDTWDIDPGDSKTLVQPLSSIKGLGEKAIEQIVNNRPFNSADQLLFSDGISYSKLNKKALDVLCRSGALKNLIDDRFSGAKHFWSAVAVDRPKSKKRFEDNIDLYEPEGNFTNEELVENLVSLTGIFPMHMIMHDNIRESLDENCVPPLGEWDNDISVAWFVPREVLVKKTARGRPYYIIKVIDSTSKMNSIKCWGVQPGKDNVFLNHPYMARLDYDEQWGFSAKGLKNFRLLG